MKIYLCFFFLLSSLFNVQAQFTLPSLGFPYNALEPHIDAQTMEIHITKHHAAYVNNLNKAMAGIDSTEKDVIKIISKISTYPESVRNNAGGHYNHSLFWTILTPEKTEPSAHLLAAINTTFTGLDSLKSLLNKAASTRFGSGWAWLSVNPEGKLIVSSTPNQDNPIMDMVTPKGIPILGIDVWEHAYYLKYQNKRGDYLSAIWNVVNWKEVSRRYEEVVPRKKSKFEIWPALAEYHHVMAETFHPSEEGDLKPIKKRAGELAVKAGSLAKSKIPTEFTSPEIGMLLKKIESDSQKLQKAVKKKVNDKVITKALSELHDTFHLLVDKCTSSK